MSDVTEDPRLAQARAMLDQLAADHAAVMHKTVLEATLDYVAQMVVILEPQAGGVEAFVATFVGGLVAGTVVGLPFSGLATALTLFTEKGVDAGFLMWARDRIATEKGS